MSERCASKDQRGFASLIVLWTIGLLALLVAGLSASGRSASEVAWNVRESAIAEAAADGGVQRAVFELRSGRWKPGEAPHRVSVGLASVAIAVDDENGRINPNYSSPPLLAALLGAVGAAPAEAQVLSRAMIDWRTATPLSLAGGLKVDRYRLANLPYGPPSGPFESVGEIGQVVGMNDDLLARLRPYITVYHSGDAQQGQGFTFARGVLQDAAMIGQVSALVGYTSPDEIVGVRATAVLADGTRFERRAVVRLAGQQRPGERAPQILTWE